MESIWKYLPDDLVFVIIGFMDIDTRRAFKVPPKRLKIDPTEWFCPWSFSEKITIHKPLFIVTLMAPWKNGSRWGMYVTNKEHNKGRMTIYSYNTGATNKYNIAKLEDDTWIALSKII